MPGVKTFINQSNSTLYLVLFVREGFLQPYKQHAAVLATVGPQQIVTVNYGMLPNVFLNGLSLFTIFQGDLYSKVQFVTKLQTPFDDLLNMNNVITISPINTDYVYTGSVNPNYPS